MQAQRAVVWLVQKADARIKLGFVNFAEADVINARIYVAYEAVDFIGGRALGADGKLKAFLIRDYFVPFFVVELLKRPFHRHYCRHVLCGV